MRTLSTSPVPLVCVLLGPYRNLTTLTSAMLFLHPRCQVLNHEASQFFDDPTVDFIAGPTPERIAGFVERALAVASCEGSVLESHAFRPGLPARTVYEQLSLQRRRDDVATVVWKESLRVTNRLRESPELVDALVAHPGLRFLMPVRFPLDCAQSNLAGGHVHLFDGLYRESPLRDVVAAVLDMIGWFHELAQRHPESLLLYHQDDLQSPETARRISSFVGLEPTAEWLEATAPVRAVRQSRYAHSATDVAMYATLVAERFAAVPDLRDRLEVKPRAA